MELSAGIQCFDEGFCDILEHEWLIGALGDMSPYFHRFGALVIEVLCYDVDHEGLDAQAIISDTQRALDEVRGCDNICLACEHGQRVDRQRILGIEHVKVMDLMAEQPNYMANEGDSWPYRRRLSWV